MRPTDTIPDDEQRTASELRGQSQNGYIAARRFRDENCLNKIF